MFLARHDLANHVIALLTAFLLSVILCFACQNSSALIKL